MPTYPRQWNLNFYSLILISIAFTQCVLIKYTLLKSTFINVYLNNIKDTRVTRVSLIFEGNDKHDRLRHLYINREKIFQQREIADHLKNYFGLTLDNLKEHVIATMEEQIRERDERRNDQPVWVDAKIFKGAPETFKLPLDPKLSLLKGDGIQKIDEVQQEFISEFDRTIYEMLENARIKKRKSIKKTEYEKFVDLYNRVGSYEYEIVDGEIYYYTDVQPLKRIKVGDEYEKLQRKIELMSRPTRNPSFIDPIDLHIRTGRDRAIHRKRDTGSLQKKRWKMEIPPEEDIPRGRFVRGHPVIQKFVDSMDFERQLSNAQDTNYFKNNFLETGHNIPDRTMDSYFDIQFIGTPDAYPIAKDPDMTYTWPIYWVPWLAKKHPKRRGQPIKSPVFNLGGIEPLQLWFYPEGTALSKSGYSSIKLITPPGWNLPYRIYLYIFSEYNRVVSKIMYKESAEYIAFTLNSARLLPKSGIDDKLESPKDNDGYVILGPAGNVYIGVGIVDEPLPDVDFRGVKRHKDVEYKYKYDWHDGYYQMHKWLLKQTANPQDEEIMEKLPRL